MTTVRKIVESPTDSSAQLVITDAATGKMDTYVSPASTSTPGLVKLAGNLAGTSSLPTVLGGDPWAYPDGTEVFSDDFSTFTYDATGVAGWAVCDAVNPGSALSYDTTCSIFRSLSANPAIDVATRPNSLLVQPAHTAGAGMTIYRNISNVLTFSGTWTIVGKMHLLPYNSMAAAGTGCALGVCKPSATSVRDECVQLSPFSITSTPSSLQAFYSFTANTPTTVYTYAPLERLLKPAEIWWMLIHNNGSNNIYAFLSYDGQTWAEFTYYAKSPNAFTHVWIYFAYVKHASSVTYQILGTDYVRAYQSKKLR